MSGAVVSHQGSSVSLLAGNPTPKKLLIDLSRLESEYFNRRPDPSDPNQLVSFGTSGHRGAPFTSTFTEAHILSITQAICDYAESFLSESHLIAILNEAQEIITEALKHSREAA